MNRNKFGSIFLLVISFQITFIHFILKTYTHESYFHYPKIFLSAFTLCCKTRRISSSHIPLLPHNNKPIKVNTGSTIAAMLTTKIQGGESVPPRLIEFDQSPCYPEFRNSLVRSMRGRSTVSCTRGCTSVFACPAREEGRRVGVVRRGGGRGQARSIKPPPPSSPLEVSGAAYEKWFRQRWRWQQRTRKGGCIDSAKPHRSLRRPPSSSSFSLLLHISLKVPWPLELRRRLHSWHAAT